MPREVETRAERGLEKEEEVWEEKGRMLGYQELWDFREAYPNSPS